MDCFLLQLVLHIVSRCGHSCIVVFLELFLKALELGLRITHGKIGVMHSSNVAEVVNWNCSW